MKKVLYGLFIILFIAACSKNEIISDDDEDNDDNTETPALTYEIDLNSNRIQANIFEPTQFTLAKNGQQLFFPPFSLLTECYDSIIWKASNVEGSYKIFEYDIDEGSSYHHFISSWAHHFTLPGSYDTYILAYKDNKVVYGDTVSVKVTNNKEFLGFNWKDVTNTPNTGNTGYIDVLKEYNFSTYQEVHESIPSVTLTIWGNKNEDESTFLPKSKKHRRNELELLNKLSTTIVLYEAPHRIIEVLEDVLDYLGDRKIAIARELTKLHEEFFRGTVKESIAWLNQQQLRGEFVLVLSSREFSGLDTPANISSDEFSVAQIPAIIEDMLAQGIDKKQAIADLAKRLKVPKKTVYNAVVNSKNEERDHE